MTSDQSRTSRTSLSLPLLTLLALAFFAPSAAANELSLSVDLSTRLLSVWEGSEIKETYKVSVGTEKYPTPTGSFKVRHIIWNPAWNPPTYSKWARKKTPKPPGHPENPMKRVKIFFSEPDYYIHGTGDLDSMGDAASHGCIRMRPSDAEAVAKILMERGGEPRPAPWYKRIFRSKKSKSVWLQKPIPMIVRE